MSSLAPCRTLLYRPVQEGPLADRKRTLIYFVTGNPGIIDYYEGFLSHLCTVLASSTPEGGIKQELCIVGHSLSGFELAGSDNPLYDAQNKPPLGLEDQIRLVEKRFISTVTDPKIFGSDASQSSELDVILVGHSVGAYIILELIRSLHARAENETGFHIVGGIGLFPTITHIGKSPNGKRMTMFCSIPAFPQIASIVVRCLTFAVPISLLTRLVGLVAGSPPDAASTVAKFIKSKYGILEAMHMARDEMNIITVDRWGEEVWGAAEALEIPKRHVKLFFYFGANDDWVANETRDELMAARAYSGNEDIWKPKMEIDDNGVPHDFCIRHSNIVAEKVASYVNQIMGLNTK